MRYWNLFFVALIGLLTACSAEEIVTTDSSQLNSQCLVLEVEKPQFGNGTTRAAISGLEMTFESGDVIGLYAVDENNTVKSSNVAFSYNGSAWSAASDVTFDPDWSYYAYYPYVASPYTPDFSQSDIDDVFATFIADASNKFHLANQSSKANFNASDLMIAQGTVSGSNTVCFTMDHKKALAYLYLPEEPDIWTSFSGGQPYVVGTKGYFCMKPNTATNVAGYELTASAGKAIKCVVTEFEHDTSGKYLTFQVLGSGTFSVSNAQGTFYYSKNGGDWAAYSSAVSVSSGDIVKWKAVVETPSSSYGVGTFAATCNFNAGGNPMSLIYGDDFADVTDISAKSYAFYRLFYYSYYLKSAEYLSLPATTLADFCCREMFYGCTSLTTAPSVLPATTLADQCYCLMFQDCRSLTTAPELPATTLAELCYGNMFRGCWSLTTAPELPATTLATGCYNQMFYGCTGLTAAPELPATTLAERCYQSMFQDCTSLTTAPELPATTLATQCYNYMFSGCSNLNYIKAMFTTTPSTSYTSNWVSDVASSGTFVKNSAATWDVTGTSGVPSGWTVETASE